MLSVGNIVLPGQGTPGSASDERNMLRITIYRLERGIDGMSDRYLEPVGALATQSRHLVRMSATGPVDTRYFEVGTYLWSDPQR